MNKPKSLYIHIPFCNHVCAYCDFVKVGYHSQLADSILDRILEDASTLEGPFDTVYFGGGTPSALSLEQLKRLKPIIQRLTHSDSEITMEINPETITQEKVMVIADLGINRISVGVQAIQPHLLEILTRKHSFKQAVDVIEWFKQANLTNISVDAMYGIPQQTIDDFKETLQAFVALDVSHISLYALTIEPNTAFGRMKVTPVDNELEGEFYELAHHFLTQKGYDHYEVSSFAKDNLQSNHNLAYWRYEDFIGLGPGAASKVNQTRMINTHNLHHYLNKQSLLQEKIELSAQESLFEHIMMGLRLSCGINVVTLDQQYNMDFLGEFKEAIQQAFDHKWLTLENNRLKTTYSGRLFLHDVLLLFMRD